MDVASRDEQLFHQAILGFDEAALAAWITRRTAASEGDSLAADAAADCVADVARAWLGLMRGASTSVAAGAGELFARASSSRDPSRVIEVTALRAMLALSLGQLSDAAAFARRASLMARTEALPAAELLANVTLSRLRRHSGKPYLALRILESLGRTDAGRAAPGWLEWERLLAGGAETNAPSGAACGPALRTVQAGRRVLGAARAGERDDFEQQAAELERASAGFSDMQREARALCALLDPARTAEEPLAAFRRGEHDEIWHGLVSVP